MEPENDDHDDLKPGIVRVWCYECFYHWQGDALNFGHAVADHHARRNPGHRVNMTMNLLHGFPGGPDAAA